MFHKPLDASVGGRREPGFVRQRAHPVRPGRVTVPMRARVGGPITASLTRSRRRPRVVDWIEIIRPFSLTGAFVAAIVGAATSWVDHPLHLAALGLTLVGVLLMQAGTNVVNEVYDAARGVDSPETPGASHAVVTGRVPAELALRAGLLLLVLAVADAVLLSWTFHLGPVPVVIGLAGAVVGHQYTAPPLQFKYRGLGVPAVALMLGPLVVLGAQYVQLDHFTVLGLAASVPVALLVTAILVANDLRDRAADKMAGIRTEATILGATATWQGFVALLLGAYAFVLVDVATSTVPWPVLLVMGSLPLALSTLGTGARGALDHLDQRAAAVHLCFGLLLAAGLAIGRVLA